MRYRLNVTSDKDYSIEQATEIINGYINYGWKLIDIKPVQNKEYKFLITVESLNDETEKLPFGTLNI